MKLPRGLAFPLGREERVLGANILLVGGAMVGAKALGFGEKQVLAYTFGTGPMAETYLVVSGFVSSAGILARELTEPIVLPLFATGGPEHTAPWRVLWRALLVAAAVSFAVASVVSFAPGPVVSLLAPGLYARAGERATQVLAMAAWAAVPIALCALVQAALNGMRRFGTAAASDLVYRAVLVASCLFAAHLELAALPIGLGFLVAAAVKLAMQANALKRPRDVAGSRVAPLAGDADRRAPLWPLLIGMLSSQVCEVVETRYSSLVGDGALAARLYARKIADLPILLGPYILSAVSFPYFTRCLARGERARSLRLATFLVNGCLLVMIPVALALSTTGQGLVSLLLERGQFDAEATRLTAEILAVYAVGMVAFTLDALLVPLFFAIRDTRTPIFVGVAGVLLHLAVLPTLAHELGVLGIAGSLVLAKTLKVLGLLLCLQRSQRAWMGDLPRSAAKLTVAFGAAMTLVVRMLVVRGEPENVAAQLVSALLLALSAAVTLRWMRNAFEMIAICQKRSSVSP